MKRIHNTKTVAGVVLALILFLSLPINFTQKLRSAFDAFVSPIWMASEDFTIFFSSEKSQEEQQAARESERLALQNMLLRRELQTAIELLRIYEGSNGKLEQNPIILPAQVIYRAPLSWNSTLWINVGEKDNERLQTQVIAKNSPVLAGLSLVGVVEEVGKEQSRIRLITDSRLTPSVRVARGKQQTAVIKQKLETLKNFLVRYEQDEIEKHAFLQQIMELEQDLIKEENEYLLAKGELRGNSHPLWRAKRSHLQGIGFNYDFSDEAGPARDLRTGAAIGDTNTDPIPIIKLHDVLVTTGMDGIFPPGLQVAIVTKVFPLKEGEFFYEIEAIPTAGNLNELSTLFVIPPVNFHNKIL